MNYISLSQKLAIPESLTFDDVLLLPNYADFTRDETDLSLELHPKIQLKIPIISSPMDTVTMSTMAIHLAQQGGLGIIHRNLAIREQAQEITKVKNFEVQNPEESSVDKLGRLVVGGAVGIGKDMEDRVKALVEAGADLILVDSAHGHTKGIVEAVKKVRELYPQIPLMAGNVATYEGAKTLIEAGVDILRVGMGPGSICTTRIVTGMGVPQLTAISEVARIAKEKGVKVVADGGIKQIGEIAKAIGFGANCVMLGSMLSGFSESPGNLLEHEGKTYKTYRGMGSVGAMVDGSSSRYGQGPDPKKMVAEGIEALVPFKGSVDEFLNQIIGGIRSSLFYVGAKNLQEIYQKSRFVKISGAGLKESHPHSVIISDPGKSYQL